MDIFFHKKVLLAQWVTLQTSLGLIDILIKLSMIVVAALIAQLNTY